jgi:hypothetical protein
MARLGLVNGTTGLGLAGSLLMFGIQNTPKVPREWNFRAGEIRKKLFYNPANEAPITHPE